MAGSAGEQVEGAGIWLWVPAAQYHPNVALQHHPRAVPGPGDLGAKFRWAVGDPRGAQPPAMYAADREMRRAERRRVAVGPGVPYPKSRRRGVSRPRRRQSRSPAALPGRSRGRQPPCVVERAADPALERAQRYLRALALGDFAVIAGAAFAVEVAELSDCGHVDVVVKAAVPTP